eukprot:3284563-Prymnesium_polylepis.2
MWLDDERHASPSHALQQAISKSSARRAKAEARLSPEDGWRSRHDAKPRVCAVQGEHPLPHALAIRQRLLPVPVDALTGSCEEEFASPLVPSFRMLNVRQLGAIVVPCKVGWHHEVLRQRACGAHCSTVARPLGEKGFRFGHVGQRHLQPKVRQKSGSHGLILGQSTERAGHMAGTVVTA